ncbi:MAG: SMR family transporter [Halieaceae bacterium]
MHYGYLLIAVVLEVCGTLLLPASQNFTRPAPTVGLVVCYAAAFYCLTFALSVLPVAVVYATWSALGIFLITLMGYLILDQALEWRAWVGLALIVMGVMLVNIYGPER